MIMKENILVLGGHISFTISVILITSNILMDYL